MQADRRGELREPGVAALRPPGCWEFDNGLWQQWSKPADWLTRFVEPGDLEATAASRGGLFRGWILYDDACSSCTAFARRFNQIFRRRGFFFLPLQMNWVRLRPGHEPGAPLEEMRVLTADGQDFGAADAVFFLARQIWWTWPFVALARLPGLHHLLDRGYRWIAAHRGCNHTICNLPPRRWWPGWIALMAFATSFCRL